VKRLIQEAIEFHLEDLTESGAEIPAPTSKSDYVEVLAA
jgi:predicted RNase H-like HicB family nuclease